MPFQAQVILDSIGPQNNRLTTMEFTIPKLWLAEFNTHCMFARNSASTRAIPFKKQVELMLADPFVPQEWPLENPGMSAKNNEERPDRVGSLQAQWKIAMHSALREAKVFAEGHGIHKQLSGRLLELWRFQTVLITGDEASYANFFHLRRDKAAAPEIRQTAELMWAQYRTSCPTRLKAEEWHLPLVTTRGHSPSEPGEILVDLSDERGPTGCDPKKISSARCARLSYLTHHGVRDLSEDLNLFSKLTTGGHWSPLEHVCMALAKIPGWKQEALKLLGAAPTGHGKWQGWHQYRKDFPNEYWTQIGS